MNDLVEQSSKIQYFLDSDQDSLTADPIAWFLFDPQHFTNQHRPRCRTAIVTMLLPPQSTIKSTQTSAFAAGYMSSLEEDEALDWLWLRQ